MDWFTQDQVVLRTIAYARHGRTELKTEARISLVTGTRWSEGEELKKASSRNTKSLTPTLKAENRAVPISKELYGYLPDDRKGRLFSDCYGAFRSALERMGIELPAGNLPTFCATPSLVTL